MIIIIHALKPIKRGSIYARTIHNNFYNFYYFHKVIAFFYHIQKIFLGRRKKKSTLIILDEALTHKTPKNQKKPDWVIAEVIKIKAYLGNKIGCRQVAHSFNRLHGHKITVGKSFVNDVIKNNAYQIQKLQREKNKKLPTEYNTQQIWALDLSYYSDTQKNTHAFLGIIDHGSRCLMHLNTVINRKSWAILGYLCLSIAKYGKPTTIRTDNEKIFNSFVFNTFLKLANIKHQTTQKAAPWQNGRIERLFGTLKPFLRRIKISNKETLNQCLEEFKIYYNHIRVHSAIHQTPAECYQKQDLSKIKRVRKVSFLGGLARGFYIQRE